ncbi:MAG: DNA-binding transcriptional MerR regulator [Rickettsiales bacterium]|jgi:DNA-binding transcriptional MerR regulator
MKKIIDKKRSIGTVADELGVRTHVIRFWEEKFSQIKPQIGKGDRRYYFNDQVAVLKKIKSLLHDEGYSIAGLQKLLNKRKKSDLKENNLEFLRAKDVQNIDEENEDSNLISLGDFIDPSNPTLVPDLNLSQKEEINKILSRIEENLEKLSS